MRRQVRIIALAVLAGSAGCNLAEEQNAAVSVSEADSAGVRIVTVTGPVANLPEWSLADAPVTEISGDAEPFLGSVGQVEFLDDERLLVEDRMTDELRLFDGDGSVVRLLAGPGDGPGELEGLMQLSVIPGDTVWAFDVLHARLTALGSDGALLASMPVERELGSPGTVVRNAWGLGSGRFVLYGVAAGPAGPPSDPPQRAVRDAIIQISSEDGATEAPRVVFTGGYNVRSALGEAGSPFSNRPFTAVGADRILHGSGVTYEILLRDADLQPRMVIRWPDWERAVLTPSRLDALLEPMSASLHELRAAAPEAADRLMDALLHPDVLPDALPALGSALLDDGGRIWVSAFRFAPEIFQAVSGGYEPWDQEDAWHVLDPTGRPLARLRLPPETRLLAVRGDRVAVVDRDAVGVEHVRVFVVEAAG